MAWRLKLYYSDGTDEILDDIFESEEAAEAEYDEYLDSCGSGCETLQLNGDEDYDDADIEDCDIWEE